MTASPMVSGTLAALGNPVAVGRRAEGVRRADDLDGYARCMGEGLRDSEDAS